MLLIYDSIIALTQQITALFITFYLLQLPAKARYTWWFAAFFLGITLVTLALFLEASVLVWGRLFFGLRVCAALAAQASLIQFAYHFPQNDQPRQARLLLRCFLGLLLIALIASGVSVVQVLAAPAQADPAARMLLTLLLPLGVLAVIVVLLRRALHLHCAVLSAHGPPRRGMPRLLQALVAPASPHAAALRTFGAVLLLGLLPASVPLLRAAGHISAPVAAYLVGLGTLLVLLALFLTFLTYTRQSSSFIARIFSIALVLLLALSGMTTLVLTGARNAQFRQTRQWQINAVQQVVQQGELDDPAILPAEVAYVVALTPPTTGTDPAPRYQPRYTAPDFPPDDLARLDVPTQRGGRTLAYLREMTYLPGILSRLRSADQSVGMLPRYVGYRVSSAGQDYEIGFRLADDLRAINRANLQLILVLVTSSLILWGALRLFLHTNLVQPLTALLDGIRQAHQGKLNQQLPVRYEDEIGFLTHSFNTMMHSIHTAQAELRAANLHLEERVQQRTAELQQEMAALQQANQQIGEQQQAIAMLRERERLARELHDNLGQVLGYVNTQAQATRTALETDQVPQARELLDQIAGVSRSMLTDIREYILGVQVGTMLQTSEPIIPTSGAFVAALDTYMREFEQIWHIRTTLRLPPNAREVAFAPTIETHLFRVVQEALTNIRKHASASHVEVALQLPLSASEPTTAADTRELVITITDNGQGFAVHAHNGTAPSGGHGFGLTSMRGRVAEIGGTLTIESIPTAGTTLTVQVPLRRQGDITQQPVRLLLVDDNALFLRGLHSLLEVNGFQVVGTAGNGDEAQAQARTLEPDVILMDVQMPKCDGLAATRAIKADMPHIQIVMLTVSDDDAHLFEALRSGASGYLLKSLESEDLCTLLLGLMRGEVPFSPGLAARVLHELTHSDTSAGAAPPEQSALPEAHLTEQQITLLTLLAQGQTQQEVGERMGYTRRTISRHLATIIDMLHLCNRAEAIAYARQKLEQGDWPVPPGDEE